MSNLKHTRAALKRFDSITPALDRALSAAKGEDCGLILAAHHVLEEMVALAFWRDTKEINNLDTILETIKPGPAEPDNIEDLSYVRRMAWNSEVDEARERLDEQKQEKEKRPGS